MPDEKLRVKQGQKLNQASQDVGDPRNMAKILGVAGEGLWDFLGLANENLVPQSVEELALEGSPAGKAIGTAVGLIPPKYIKPLVQQLKNRVLNNPATPYKDLVEEAIDLNPRVASNVGDFVDTTRKNVDPGYYDPGTLDYRTITPDGEFTTKTLERALANNTSVRNSSINLNPQLIELARKDPRRVLRHEMVHAAQDAWEPLKLRNAEELLGNYKSRPIEVGARMAEDSQYLRLPMSQRLERELNSPGFLPTAPDGGFDGSTLQHLGQLQQRLKNQRMRIVLSDGRPLEAFDRFESKLPYFAVQKIVLDR